MEAEQWDAIVIGAGQAGPTLAVRLAKEGRRTVLLEREPHLGGTCVNNGCTPTKTLVASARVAHMARRAADFGVRIDSPVAIDYTRVHARMQGIVQQSRDSLAKWIASTEGLTLIHGHARFVSADAVSVGDRLLRAPQVFLNVGCRPTVPDWARDAGVPYLTSESLLALKTLPSHLVIVGGGYVGLEFAQIFARLGSKVTVAERADRLLAREDDEAATVVREALEADGVKFESSASCFGLKPASEPGHASLTFRRSGADHTVSASHVLLALGREPNTDDLGLETTGVQRDDKGFVKVDGKLRTNVPGIWAMGDVNGRGAFTHTSWNDHEIVVANLLDGEDRSIDGRVPPYALYVDPPLARMGDSEHQARARGTSVLVGMMPMTRVGRARERSETRGFMKVLVDAQSMQLLGATFVCADADEIIHSLINAKAAGVDVRTLARTLAIHPTISELIPTMLQQLQPLPALKT